MQTLTQENGVVRMDVWLSEISKGVFSFGPAQVIYDVEGLASWKYQALGIETQRTRRWDRFDYTPAFLTSNWKLFHDAAQAHQFEILHEILPEFGICAI
jgi:hypothetical protein